MLIYTIEAEYGEMDDRENQMVCAFSKREDAEIFINDINKWLDDHEEEIDSGNADDNDLQCPYDPMIVYNLGPITYQIGVLKLDERP